MIRTGFSYRYAAGHLEDVMKRVKEIGLAKAPICDRNSTFGFNRWAKLCKKEGLEPVFGVEIAVTPQLGDKKPTLDYWRFIAKDSLRPLHDLITLATGNPGKEPSITYEQAQSAKGLFKISGERVQLGLCSEQGDDFFIGMGPSLPVRTYRDGLHRGFRFCSVSDNCYTQEDDREFWRCMLGGRANTQSYPQHILSGEEWLAATSYASKEEQIKATAVMHHILEQSTAKLKKATMIVPEKPKTLRQLCLEGAERLGCDLSRPGYTERMDRELAMIAEKKFEDYFFVLADAILWAKERMIVGPARGSSCGSLVCYLIGITAVDPIPYGLIFERFIDVTRLDLPDVDIDFSDEKRHLVFEYVEQKYGRDRIARLGSIGQFKPKSALPQVGKALKIPTWMIEKVSQVVIERKYGDSRASSTIEDTLKTTEAGKKMLAEYPESMIVARMERHPNNPGQHAAGIVITNDPINEFMAVDQRTGATMCDKRDAEDLDLLKIDALGLKQLSVFERCLELIGVKENYNDWLNKIPLNDPAAFEVINRGDYSGVFQFIGTAVQSVAKAIQINDVEDLFAITALARPGPLASGGTDQWVRRRTRQQKVEYAHPIFEPYVKDTLGIVVYQETVLNIGREVGGLSWADVTALRKAMSKSLGKEYFDQFGDRWKAEAIRKGVPSHVADKFWDDMCQFGAWAFNRSHSVAYGLVSYWCMWLKAHYPLEYAAACLDRESDAGDQIRMLRELAKAGVEYVPVDPAYSSDKWVPVSIGNSRKLVGPLSNIEGIGPATVMEILDARKTGKELRASVAKRLHNARTKIDSLYPIRDAIAKLHPDLSAINIHSKPMDVIDLQPGVRGSQVALVRIDRMAPGDTNAAVKVAARGGRRHSGPTTTLNVFASDDTDEMLFWVDRFSYEKVGKKIFEQGGAGKSLWAFKGEVPKDFRMMRIEQARYLGRIDEAD